MYLSASSQGWFKVVGGWSNLLQGLLSAIIAGIVAAAVSFIVVYLTNAGNRRLSRQQEARDNLVKAVEATIGTFVGVPDSRPWRKDFEDVAVLCFKLKLAAALIAEQDNKFAQRIEDAAGELAKVANGWNEQISLQEEDQAPKRYNDAYKVVRPLQDKIIAWLGNLKYRDSNEDDAPASGV